MQQQLIYNGNYGPETLAQLLERLNEDVSFDILMQKIVVQVERTNGVPTENSVILKLSSDPERIAFFNTLSQLLSAPGSKSGEKLEIIKDKVIKQFDAADKTEAESSVLAELESGIERLLNSVNLWEQFGNPKKYCKDSLIPLLKFLTHSTSATLNSSLRISEMRTMKIA